MESMKNLIYLLMLFAFCRCTKNEEIVIDTKQKANVLKIIEAESQIQSLNSVAFCVLKDDNVLWADAIGYANKEKNKLATPDTRYLIASISKAVTAIATMQLQEQQKLDLDTDINTYLPFSVRNPNFPEKIITIRMLLNHTSSISDDQLNKYNFYCFGYDCTEPLGNFVDNFFSTGKEYYSSDSFFNYTPGEKGNYTNLGYTLLGYIVEKTANQPFDEYCKQNIFLPLGMSKTEWRIKNTPFDEWAVPYSVTNTPTMPYYSFPDYPDGGLKTTVADLSKFLRMLMLDGKLNSVQILRPETIQLMRNPTVGFQRGSLFLQFGLGMYYTDIKGKILYGHGGGEQGTSTEMYYDLNSKVGVIIFTNTTNANLNLITYSLYKYGIQQ